MTKVQKIEQTPQRSPEELARLVEKQRKHQKLIARFNAEFSRPGAWTHRQGTRRTIEVGCGALVAPNHPGLEAV